MKTAATLLFGVAALIGTGAATAAQPQGQAQLEVLRQADFGHYLTDSLGHSVYLFKADKPQQSNCYGACAEAWPPVLTKATPQAGTGVNHVLLGVIERKDGARQVTYNGWPLYYYVKDQEPYDVAGQDVEGFGAEWYLVSPDGDAVHAEHDEHAGEAKPAAQQQG